MKMIYNNVPVKSMRVHNFDVNSNDATMIASDLQSGVVGYARGKKVIGTGKSFEFASYGSVETNDTIIIPTSNINVIQISSADYPIQMTIPLGNMWGFDFTVEQVVGNVIIDSISYPITVISNNNTLEIKCNKTIFLEIFYGKDNYI
jgi:hypothetical protein